MWKLFNRMKNGNNFIQLDKNEYIVKDYSNYYLIKSGIFLNLFHIFDKEKGILKIIYVTSDLNFEENRNFIFQRFL